MGTAFVGGATTVEFELDSTTLWHMWLGYMRECGMMELHKRKLLKGIKTCKLELLMSLKLIYFFIHFSGMFLTILALFLWKIMEHSPNLCFASVN